MKILTKTFSLILALIIALSVTTTAFAAEVDLAVTGAQKDVSLLAADFDFAGTKLNSDVALPSYYSSRDLGYTTDVRNQLYNTCWAYGASSTMETVLYKKGWFTNLFSPMHMNHWGTIREDGTGWNRDYYGGGYSYIALGYLSSWQGPQFERLYPETTSINSFKSFDSVSNKQAVTNGIIYLDTRDLETIKTAIYEYGAIVGNYHVNDVYYNASTYAYYYDQEGLLTSQLNGHAITVVGWDDNFSKDNFSYLAKPQNDGAWLCKNSWGEYWGDNGYYWISYEDKYIFDTRFGHSYTYNDVALYDKTMSLYQNEIDGATYEFENDVPKNSITYINVFDKNGNYDVIDKVNFESVSENALYNIYTIPLSNDGTPVNDRSKWIAVAGGIVSYSGYHSIDVDDFLIDKSKFAVGVELTRNNGSNNSIGVNEWLSTGGSVIYTPDTQHGKSFICYSNGDVVDIMDYYKEVYDDDIGGLFVIKAVGVDTVTRYPKGDPDMDKKMSILDATLIQMALAKNKTITDKQSSLADFDSDGILSILDATIIQFALAGKDIPDHIIPQDPTEPAPSEDFEEF